ncbi:MAG: PAS domain S-box protein [Syntrophales bacterium]
MKDDDKTKKQLVDELTELHSQNEALKNSENPEKYRSLVEDIRDVIYELDSQGVVLYISPAIRDLLGYDSAEILGKNFIELAHKDDLSSCAEWFSELRKGVESPSEYRIIDKSGEYKWAQTRVRPIMEGGEFRGARGILIDVTEQKRVEATLRESEEKYRSVFENSIMGISRTLRDGRLIAVNNAYAKMYGYADAEEMMAGVSSVGPLYANPEEREDVLRILTEKGVMEPREITLIRRDGTRFIVLAGTREIRDSKGNLLYYQVEQIDITDRKRAEKQLQDTLESLRKAVGATIQVLVSAVEARDPYTAGHQTRSADLARAIAIEMGLPKEKIEGIRMAGSIHDIGKLSIPAEILSKPTKLSEIEFPLIKEHAQKGFEMLKDVESPWPLAEIVHQHHERMDGSGYPRHLKGEEILMEARILAVADVVEAMASHRPYRPSLGIDAALKEIEKNKGIFYDDSVADACLRLFREKGFQLAVS